MHPLYTEISAEYQLDLHLHGIQPLKENHAAQHIKLTKTAHNKIMIDAKPNFDLW